MSKRKSILLWGLAFLFTVAIIFYQRLTGPTYPVKGSETINGHTVKYKFLRSHTAFEELPVTVEVQGSDLKGFIKFRRYKSGDEWTEKELKKEGDNLTAMIPGLQSAGKTEYLVELQAGGRSVVLNKGRSIVARFKNKVPDLFLITHILLMILSFLFAIRTGLEALLKNGKYYRLVSITLFVVFLGGMIFGPIVQKYAFGDLWTGIPFGFDLTDNKTLLAFLLWIIAYIMKKKSRWYVVAASVLMIAVYLIPHSVLGSEIDYRTGKMKNKFSLNNRIEQQPESPLLFRLS